MGSKKRPKSSIRWLREHFSDKYVLQAKEMGFRSRAWFKLDEIQNSSKIFKSGMIVIDLGAAPGSWSQYAATKVSYTGQVIACDLLPMDPIVGVHFLQGDFRNEKTLNTLLKLLGNRKVQIIMSDMAPNTSGIPLVDTMRSMHLVELALNLCRYVLATNGSFIVKIFQGEGFEKYLSKIHSLFLKVKIHKPDASRLRSREVYIVTTGYKK